MAQPVAEVWVIYVYITLSVYFFTVIKVLVCYYAEDVKRREKGAKTFGAMSLES